MDLTVLNTNLEAIAVIDTYNSLIWTDRYNECGDFEIYTAMTDGILDFIKQDYYLRRKESEHIMIIEKLLISSDSEDGDMITITGRSLESILDRRVVWGQKTISGNLQNGIQTLLNEAIISPSNEKRKISNFIFEASTDEAITKLTIDAQYTGDNLYDVVTTICSERDIGFKVTLNDNSQFVFKLYAGTDRSYDQTEHPYVVFSPKFDNLISSNYIESKSGMKNVTLVGGEGEGSARKYTDVGNVAGLDRREIFTDARDVSSDIGDGKTLTTEEYTAQLRQRGQEILSANKDVVSFEGQAETSTMFVYGVDFFNGDVVQIANEYGHEARARILEIITSESTEGYSVYPTFSMIGINEEEGTLPDGYTELAAIQSSGTQYIDTGFKPNENSRVVIDVEVVSQTSASNCVFGARNSASPAATLMFDLWSMTTGTAVRSGYFGASVTGTYSLLNNRTVIDKNKNSCLVGETSISNAAASGQSALNLYLFNVNNSGAINDSYATSMKLYSCKIYDNGTLVRDFIPCTNLSGTVGLYDIVGKQFYANAGTGTFTAVEKGVES